MATHKEPFRSPEADLAEALGTLERLNDLYSKRRDVAFMLDLIEAAIQYALSPDMLVAHETKAKR